MLFAPAEAAEAPPADLAAMEKRLEAVYEQVAPAIVRFGYSPPSFGELSFGSGVIVSADGHIAVSGPVHAVLRDELLKLRLADGRRVRGRALGWSSEFGFGLLKITEPGPWPHVDLERGTDAKAGQLCIALGYPRGRDGRVDEQLALRLGAVTKSAGGVWLTSSYRFRAGAHAVFDLDGRLLGLNKSTPVGGDPEHTSAALIKAHWDDLVAGKNLDRARLYAAKPAEGAPAAATQTPARADPAAAPLENAQAATVRINEAGDPRGIASGVIVTPVGHVVTCGHHGRMPGEKLTVSLRDGRDANAIVLGTNLICDVGLLKIADPGPWPHAPLGRSAAMQPGDACNLVGYPRQRPGREPWVFPTRVIEPSQTLKRKDAWYCEFWTAEYPASLQGASGGGVFDPQGRVIGVLLGGAGDEMQHSRVELFGAQWDVLSAGRPVDLLRTEPLGPIAEAFGRAAKNWPNITVEVLADGERKALATLVGGDGLLLTKASVPAEGISCRLSDGSQVAAQVQKRLPKLDLAVLKIDVANLPEPRFGNEDNPIAPGKLVAVLVPGEPPRVGVVWFAAGAKPSVGVGPGTPTTDEQPGREVADLPLGTDIQLPPESCGAPLVDRQGRVVGIVISSRSEHGGFGQSQVVPASAARKAMAN